VKKWEIHVLMMLLIGFLLGALAKFTMPGKDPGGTMLLGIAGALVAGLIGRLLGLYASGQRAGFIMSTLGAILLLALYRGITHRYSSV
jgi:uncharacterized membrane protein YeaQ/YmgE (transglycosylase-associated protein family)